MITLTRIKSAFAGVAIITASGCTNPGKPTLSVPLDDIGSLGDITENNQSNLWDTCYVGANVEFSKQKRQETQEIVTEQPATTEFREGHERNVSDGRTQTRDNLTAIGVGNDGKTLYRIASTSEQTVRLQKYRSSKVLEFQVQPGNTRVAVNEGQGTYIATFSGSEGSEGSERSITKHSNPRRINDSVTIGATSMTETIETVAKEWDIQPNAFIGCRDTEILGDNPLFVGAQVETNFKDNHDVGVEIGVIPDDGRAAIYGRLSPDGYRFGLDYIIIEDASNGVGVFGGFEAGKDFDDDGVRFGARVGFTF